MVKHLLALGYQMRDGKMVPPAVKAEGPETPGGGQNERRTGGALPTSPDVIPAVTIPEREYTVAEGDLLYRIARREYGDGELWRKVAAYNPGKVGPDGQLRVGTKIKLPAKETLVGPSKAPPKALPISDVTRLAKDSPAKKADVPSAKQAAKTRSYTVKKGDTLGTIAMRELGTTKRANEILDLNRNLIKNPNAVPLGVTIRLPA